MKRYHRNLYVASALLVFSLGLFVYSTFAWFTHRFDDSVEATVGFVEVDFFAYFIDETNPASDYMVPIAPPLTKTGIYEIDITTNTTTINFFDNLRVRLEVKSNIPTYFRIKVYEQLTLKYLNFDGSTTELSVLIDGIMPFNFEIQNWYDNRDQDNYIYYMLPVMRESESQPLDIPLINPPEEPFGTYSQGYSLQITFSIEAVQAVGGPQNVWNLAQTPWGISW
ncbi:MAG: hypothetical protein PHW40_06740 [Candidatus Izemoplasmatales bacterium]|nr:hypothetical protein [Candidatus Izemoplasmatales bacterium]